MALLRPGVFSRIALFYQNCVGPAQRQSRHLPAKPSWRNADLTPEAHREGRLAAEADRDGYIGDR
jgi:hypothetical protein